MILSTDPIDWLLDNNGDLVIPLQHVRGIDAVRQGIQVRLRMIRGEWFLNLDEGVAWLDNDVVAPDEAILGNLFSDALLRAEARKAILKTPGVDTINSLQSSFDPTTRAGSVTFDVTAVFGDTVADTLAIKV